MKTKKRPVGRFNYKFLGHGRSGVLLRHGDSLRWGFGTSPLLSGDLPMRSIGYRSARLIPGCQPIAGVKPRPSILLSLQSQVMPPACNASYGRLRATAIKLLKCVSV